MSPRRPGGDPDALAELRRLVAESSARARSRAGRRSARPRVDVPGRGPETWAPGEEWDGEDAWTTDEDDEDDEDDEEEDDDEPDGRWWQDEAPARPIRVEGGLAARTRRGPMGATWWSRRFLAALEAAMAGGRPARGRAYARAGQVVRLEVRSGVVEAAVQGSRPDPYRVRLTMPVVAADDWGRIVDDLAARAGYAARMLAGELPHELEGVFEAHGCALFPAPGSRLTTECTCPDWANPCKHVAAVCYLLAESFDDDPFALLAWRGHPREEVLAELRRRRAGAVSTDAPPAAVLGRASSSGGRPRADPLEALVGDWWHAGGGLSEVHVHPQPVAEPAAVLEAAAPGAVVVGGTELSEVLAPLYPVMAAAALRRALGDG